MSWVWNIDMATFGSDVDRLLAWIEEHCDVGRYRQQWIAFILDCIALVEHRLPNVAAASLQVAKEYAEGKGSQQAVGDALRDCWLTLRDGHQQMRLDVPDVSGTRAVI